MRAFTLKTMAFALGWVVVQTTSAYDLPALNLRFHQLS